MRNKKPKVIILDDNPLSIMSYLEEFGDPTAKKRRKINSDKEKTRRM